MEKSKIVMGILAAATLGACQSSKVKISGRLVGADARQVYIEQLSAGGKAPLIDSVSLDDAGNYRFELKNVPSTPSLYTISYNGESVPVLIEGGDRLTINSAGSFARNYTVEGNEESSLLREFNLAYVEGAEKLNDIAAAYARNGQSEEELKRLAKAYSDEYLRIKRAQLAFIVEHKASIAAVYALSQRLPGDRYLFNGQGDAVYYRTVADALEERYPQSPSGVAPCRDFAPRCVAEPLGDGLRSGFPRSGNRRHVRQEGAAVVARRQCRADRLLVAVAG